VDPQRSRKGWVPESRMVGRVSGLILEREERGYRCWDILWIGVPLERTGLISGWLDGFLVCKL